MRPDVSATTPLKSAGVQSDYTATDQSGATLNPTSDATGGKIARRRSSVWSKISEGYNSTKQFMGLILPANFFHILACCGFQLFSSVLAPLATKKVLSFDGFPTLSYHFVTSFGMACFSCIMSLCCSGLNKDHALYWTPLEKRWDRSLKLLPLTILFTTRCVSTNYAIKIIQLSSYQITRQSSVVWSTLFSVFMLRYRPSWKVLASLGLIIFSVIIAGYDPKTLTARELMYGSFAAMIVSVFNVAIKWHMPIVNNDHRLLTLYNTLDSAIITLPIIFLTGEIAEIQNLLQHPKDPNANIMLAIGLTIACVAAFLINVSTNLVIKVASPVTFDVIGNVRMAVQFVVAVWFCGDEVTANKIVGNVFAICGGVAYATSKYQDHRDQMKKKASEKLMKKEEV